MTHEQGLTRTDDPLRKPIAVSMIENPKQHEKKAREETRKYAVK